MKTKLLLCSALLTAFGVNAFAQTQTGRQLDVISTDASIEPAPLPSVGDDTVLFIERPLVGIFWDERCASVEYTFNSNVGANPGTGAEISPEDLADIVQTGLDRWNDNPSSYIDMNVTNVTDLGNRPRIGGDFINEVTFITPPGFTALASSPSFSLTQDQTFAVGEDLDGDGDSDVFDPVAADRNTCFDFDGDGDIEFPAGDYAAGTILDNDVQFGSGVLWETTPTNGGGADVDAVSTHEFGHSHGLSHAITNQTGDNDGTSSTMFPFISTAEANSEGAQRTPNADDLAASAHIYQEGNGTTEISEIQPGDIAFDDAYALISGTASFDAAGTPLPGAAVKAIDFRSQSVAAQTYSGRTSAFETPTGGLAAFPESLVSGDYELPVLRNNLYTVEIEALDGQPVATGSVSTSAIIAGILGVNEFPDEAVRRGVTERAVEVEPLRASLLSIRRSNAVNNLDIVANTETIQRNSNPATFVGTGAIFGANDIVYAEMFDRTEVSELLATGNVPVSGGAETFMFGEDASTAIFSDAQLAIGTVDATGTVNITQVLSSEQDVAGQDDDTATFAFNRTRALPFQIRRAFNADPNAQLFFILELNDVVIGPNSGFPLAFVGVDGGTAGSSFLGIDNGPVTPFASGWAMELRYANPGRRVSPFLTRF